jgi:hypothetical protein
MTVASRGGILVHLTGPPDVIITRLSSRDGAAPEAGTIGTIVTAYQEAFALLEGVAPVLVVDITNTF